MRNSHYLIQYTPLILITILYGISSASAQIIPDNNFSESSIVNQIGNTSQITGGAIRGRNLFHSFSQFNIGNSQAASFNADLNTANIFARVLGGQSSNILGTITVPGISNLFLINPSGILFGPNARLDIGGSFTASTSTQFQINSGSSSFDFLSTNIVPNALLDFQSIDIHFSGNSGSIDFANFGHTILQASPFLPNTTNTTLGLQVPSGQSLAFIGNGINSSGGVVSAPSGNLIVGSIETGGVTVQNGTQLGFSLDQNSKFSDITLSNRSLLDASGGGNISVFGKNLSVMEGSTVLVENSNLASGGSIDVLASENLNIVGVSSDTFFRSSLAGEAIGLGDAPTLSVEAGDISILDGGIIGIRNFGPGSGGEIDVSATGLIRLADSFLLLPTGFSSIASITVTTGTSADVSINADRLVLQNGGNVGTSTFGLGNSGEIEVNVLDTIDIVGFSPSFFAPSVITAATFAIGDAGDIQVNTETLNLSFGGSVATTTLGQGDAGGIDINASKSITLNGLGDTFLANTVAPIDTTINSNAEIFSPLQLIFNLPPSLSGSAGSITINTPSLTLTNGAEISVLNEGLGSAGDIQIQTGITSLLDSSISASTISGSGGNIFISSQLLTAFGESSIVAQSDNGLGGAIDINVDGFLVSPSTLISASSSLGTQFDGSVEVSITENQLREKPQEIIIEKPNISLYAACSSAFPHVAFSAEGKNSNAPIDRKILAAASLKQRMNIASQYTYMDTRSGEEKPFKRWLGMHDTDDGDIKFIYEPEENQIIEGLLSSLEIQCSTIKQS